MKYYAQKHGVHVQNAYSPEGEKRFDPFRVDGWIASQQKILEVFGCAWLVEFAREILIY